MHCTNGISIGRKSSDSNLSISSLYSDVSDEIASNNSSIFEDINISEDSNSQVFTESDESSNSFCQICNITEEREKRINKTEKVKQFIEAGKN